jgi:hypothetical protein
VRRERDIRAICARHPRDIHATEFAVLRDIFPKIAA